jgi:hypothetical protein
MPPLPRPLTVLLAALLLCQTNSMIFKEKVWNAILIILLLLMYESWTPAQRAKSASGSSLFLMCGLVVRRFYNLYLAAIKQPVLKPPF